MLPNILDIWNIFQLSPLYNGIFSAYFYIEVPNMEILALNFPCLQIAIGQHGKFKKPIFKPDPKLKLMDQVRQVLRYHHYAYRTEQIYCDWVVRFIKFHGAKIHPAQMGRSETEAYPTRA